MAKQARTTGTRAPRTRGATGGRQGAANPEVAAAAAAAPEQKPNKKDQGFITVRVGLLPGRIDTIALNGGRKVSDALLGAGVKSDGQEIKVNATPAKLETDLKEGDVVLLVRKIKGNAS